MRPSGAMGLREMDWTWAGISIIRMKSITETSKGHVTHVVCVDGVIAVLPDDHSLDAMRFGA